MSEQSEARLQPEPPDRLEDQPCGLRWSRPAADSLLITFSGHWRLTQGLPSLRELIDDLRGSPPIKAIGFDTTTLGRWDSGLLVVLKRITDEAARTDAVVDRGGLPAGVCRLLDLVAQSPRYAGVPDEPRASFVHRVGLATLDGLRAGGDLLQFVGEAVLAMSRLVRGRARMRNRDLWLTIQQCGVDSLPIVSLISFLIGMILAFVGAVQLRQFGAEIYVADLVGIAMAREFAAVMTAIILAGRVGAAFAAELGAMKVNEEIDALLTLGLRPMDTLVLPRVIALAIMMPFLVLYADMIGICGGAVVGVGMLDLSLAQYFQETQAALSLTDFGVGMAKSVVFGVMVALAACMRGLQCQRSAAAVGRAVTSAVVIGIVSIIVVDALFAVLLDRLGM